MATLYLRNVPEEVAAQLRILAEREGLSTSALAVRELATIAKRADNPALLGDLPDLGIGPDAVVNELDAGRSAR